VTMTEEISIISDPHQVQRIIETTEQNITRARVPESIADDVAIALLEAVNNAIIHGNERNTNKSVTIRMTIEDTKIELSVIDQGSGFDPNSLDDPRQPENVFRQNGRGLFFIRQLMDEVEINTGETGSQITMRKFWMNPS